MIGGAPSNTGSNRVRQECSGLMIDSSLIYCMDLTACERSCDDHVRSGDDHVRSCDMEIAYIPRI